MSCWLKQSTAVDVAIGPFLDSTDGNTVEGALTITQPDIRLKKNGGAWAQKSAAQTLSHEENGWYEIALSSTDTDTLGVLVVAVHESGALPVWREFSVVPANVYDSLFSTDLLQVDLTQLLGSAVATPTVAGVIEADVTHWLGTAAATPTVAGVPEVDLTHLVGVAQSATDLKDFADEGYDPSANKVQGVVLADTVTTYTGNTPQTGDSFALIGVTGSGLTSLASQSSLNTLDDFVDTEIADIQARLPAALVSGRIDSSVGAMAANVLTASAIADGAIDDAAVAADMDAYHGKVWIIKESTTTDHYAVVFFKNGQPVTSGITSPIIQVIKASDGTDLIASTALTEVGSLGIYKKDESTNKLVAGAIYFAKVQATIDSSTRSWLQQIGRDSA